MNKFTEEEFRNAIQNYIDSDNKDDAGISDSCDVYQAIRKNSYSRKTYLDISKDFVEHYGFRPLDFDIDIIWRQHSLDLCASWLTYDGKSYLNIFDEFVINWKDKTR
jgi:hypothetical protein